MDVSLSNSASSYPYTFNTLVTGMLHPTRRTPPWAQTIFNFNFSIQPVGRRTTFKLPLNSNLQWPRHSPSDGNSNLIFLRCKSLDPNSTCPAVKSHGIFWDFRSILNSNHFFSVMPFPPSTLLISAYCMPHHNISLPQSTDGGERGKNEH